MKREQKAKKIKSSCLGDYIPRYEGWQVSKSALNVIWKYYIAKLNEYTQPIKDDPSALILKTDCENEIQKYPKQGGIVGNAPIRGKYMLLEINPVKVRKARGMGYNAVKGDIRRIPAGPQWFDMIFDFSTIDHIPPDDVESVLKEYHRVLKNDGLLYLVAWCSHERSYQERGCQQYYFEYHRFKESVRKYFVILDCEALYRCNTILYLMTFLCKKN